METADLKQCITQGENDTTEFKENFDQEAVETAVAFANTNGGTILIGVSDPSRNDPISNRISQATEPRVVLEIESVDMEGKSVLLIRIAGHEFDCIVEEH